MNKYTKPTLQIVTPGTAGGVASSCSTGTVDAKNLMEILYSMGYDPDKVFGMMEQSCSEQPVTFDDYCKFSSGITVFYS